MKRPIVVYNSWFPFGNYIACNLFGIIFSKRVLSEVTINHEAIHTAQMKELMYLGFYLWYFFEWLVLLLRYKSLYQAYHNLSLEKEAYDNQCDLTYLRSREHLAWINYL